MSGILVIYNRNGQPVERSLADCMLAECPERSVDGQDIWSGGPVVLAHQHFWVTPEELGERQPLVDTEAELVITADLRLDNRSELARLLRLPEKTAAQCSDASLVCMAYARYGERCVDHLLGDYSFAVWDQRHQRLFLARDALGTRALYYHVDAKHCLVASDITQILAHPAVRPVINDRQVAVWLAGLPHRSIETFYADIFACPPGHAMTVDAVGVRQQRHWEVDPEAVIRYRDDAEYAEHLLALLREAVACRMRSTGPIGISLSGGLDSTSLAALVAGQLPRLHAGQERLKSFSYVFDEFAQCDERQWIHPVVERYDIDAEYILGDGFWTLSNFDHWPQLRSVPYSDAFGWMPDAVMKAAERSGVRLLLAGHYGDGLFRGRVYWPADMVRDRRALRLLAILVQLSGQQYEWSWLLRYGLIPLLPASTRNAYRSLRPKPVSRFTVGMHPRLLQLLNGYDGGVANGAKYTRPGQLARLNGLLTRGLSSGQAAVTRHYHRHRIELALPYWDRRLVEFVMALPADQLGLPGYDRAVLRNAMRGTLPEPVRTRTVRTNYQPLFRKGLLEKERERVLDLLENPLIVRRHYVKADWLGRRLSDLPEAHMGLFSVWMSVSLELWLRSFWT